MSEALAQNPLDGGADDLPRTLRREREARYREAMQRAQREQEAAPSAGTGQQYDTAPGLVGEPRLSVPDPLGTLGEPQPAIVTALNVPFMHLAVFFLKAAVAAIPALILLGAMLWCAGTVMQMLFPSLIKMRILIHFPT